jgi:hypothetical protein
MPIPGNHKWQGWGLIKCFQATVSFRIDDRRIDKKIRLKFLLHEPIHVIQELGQFENELLSVP